MRDNNAPDVIPDTHAGVVLKLASAMFRMSLIPVLATWLIAAVLSTVVAGFAGLWSSLIGGAVAVASGLATLWLMRRTASMDVHFVMAAALGGFVGKMIVLLVTMMLLRGVDGIHTNSLALTMTAIILVTAGAEARAFRKTKLPTLIIGDDK